MCEHEVRVTNGGEEEEVGERAGRGRAQDKDKKEIKGTKKEKKKAKLKTEWTNSKQ